MAEKRDIDRQREAAVSMDIGGAEDGAVKGMLPIRGVMHIIKERAIYAVKLADEIDPQRSNSKIPNTQQRVLCAGAESAVVGRTLLTARTMLNAHFLPKSFDCDWALMITFEALKDLVAMREIADSYVIAEEAALDLFRNQEQTRGSLVVPSIGDVESRCKSSLQKADHVCGAMYAMASLFYDVDVRGCHFLFNLCQEKYGADDVFTCFLSDLVQPLGFIRDARTCFEHPKPDQKCTVTDFSMTADANISRPMIGAQYRDRIYPPALVSEVMTRLSEGLPEIFELMLVHLCEKHLQSFGGMKIEVVEWPEDRRREKHVRFSYGCRLGGNLAPIG